MNRRTGWLFDSACVDEEVIGTGATGMLGTNRAIDGGIRGQEMNNSKCSSNSKDLEQCWAFYGQLGGTGAISQCALRYLTNAFPLWEKSRVGSNCSKRAWNIRF